MNIRQLQHLVLLADELSFSRAAERACLSVSAFSRSIQMLEQELGVQLFDRGPRFVAPSALGERVIVRARQMLTGALDMTREIASLTGGDAGDVSMGIAAHVNMTLMPWVLAQLRSRHSAVNLEIQIDTWDQLLVQLSQHRIDFFVSGINNLMQRDGLLVERLGMFQGNLYCRAGHPLAAGGGVSREQLRQQRIASPRLPPPAARWVGQLLGFGPDRPLSFALACDDIALLTESVLTSDMLLVALEPVVRKLTDSGALVPLVISDLPKPYEVAPITFNIGLVRLAGRSLAPASELVCGLMRDSARANLG